VRTDDEAAFVAFVHARSKPLLRTAHLLTGDRERAEDLLQVAFERVARRWSRLDGDPEAYLRRVLVNLATDRWRRAGRRVHEVPRIVIPDEPARDDPIDQVETRHDLLRALSQLGARQRAVLVLRYFDDLSEKDVAAALDCSVGNVKSTSARALARLRDLAELDHPTPDPARPRSPR
jgi:RNA polymerase sigma-70 factor (sigma-E family)